MPTQTRLLVQTCLHACAEGQCTQWTTGAELGLLSNFGQQNMLLRTEETAKLTGRLSEDPVLCSLAEAAGCEGIRKAPDSPDSYQQQGQCHSFLLEHSRGEFQLQLRECKLLLIKGQSDAPDWEYPITVMVMFNVGR